MVFDESGEVVLPDVVEFVWCATRTKMDDGTWYPWRIECFSAIGFSVLAPRRAGLEAIWMPAEAPVPPGNGPYFLR